MENVEKSPPPKKKNKELRLTQYLVKLIPVGESKRMLYVLFEQKIPFQKIADLYREKDVKIICHQGIDMLASTALEDCVKLIVLTEEMFMNLQSFIEIGRVPIVVCMQTIHDVKKMERSMGKLLNERKVFLVEWRKRYSLINTLLRKMLYKEDSGNGKERLERKRVNQDDTSNIQYGCQNIRIGELLDLSLDSNGQKSPVESSSISFGLDTFFPRERKPLPPIPENVAIEKTIVHLDAPENDDIPPYKEDSTCSDVQESPLQFKRSSEKLIEQLENDFESWPDLSSPLQYPSIQENFQMREGQILSFEEDIPRDFNDSPENSELEELLSDCKIVDKFNMAFMEIINEERTYVLSLKQVQTEYFFPLKELLPIKVWRRLVQNFEIFLKIHDPLLQKIEAVFEENKDVYLRIIELYREIFPAMRLYSDYFVHLNHLLSDLENQQLKNPAVKAFLNSTSRKLQKEKSSRCTLTAFLQYPFQHISRYPLAIRNVIKHSDSFLKKELESLYIFMKNTLDYCNSKKLEAEQQEVMLRLSKKGLNFVKTGRKLLKYSELTRIKPTKRYDCNVYLFNDLILWEDRRSGFSKRPAKVIHLNDNVIVKHVKKGKNEQENGRLFYIFDPGQVITNGSQKDSLVMMFLSETHEKALSWVKMISMAIQIRDKHISLKS